MRHGNALGCVCLSLSVCLSVSNDLNLRSFQLQSSFLVCRYIFRIFGSSSGVMVIGSKSRSQAQKVRLCILFACGLPSVKDSLAQQWLIIYYFIYVKGLERVRYWNTYFWKCKLHGAAGQRVFCWLQICVRATVTWNCEMTRAVATSSVIQHSPATWRWSSVAVQWDSAGTPSRTSGGVGLASHAPDTAPVRTRVWFWATRGRYAYCRSG